MPPTVQSATPAPTTAVLVKHLPKYVVAFGILAYATGFLVLYTFYRRGFDITDIGVDFFKPQYIHVGVLYFGMVLLIATPLVLLTVPKGHSMINYRTILRCFNVLLTFYGFAIFTPPGLSTEGENWFLLLAIPTLTLLGLTGVRLFSQVVIPEHRERIINRCRVTLLVIQFVFIVILFKDLAPSIGRMLWDGGIFLF